MKGNEVFFYSGSEEHTRSSLHIQPSRFNREKDVRRKARIKTVTWNRCWDHLRLNLGQTGTLDMTGQVGPVQPVCVPVHIKRQDATISGKQMGLTGLSLSKLQLD